jgi:hypothetical protein
LHTWLDDEDRQLCTIANTITEEDLYLGSELQAQYFLHRHVNDDHCRTLKILFGLPGFTGKPYTGTRLGEMQVEHLPSQPFNCSGNQEKQAEFRFEGLEEWGEDIMEDDELNEQVLALGDFLESRYL